MYSILIYILKEKILRVLKEFSGIVLGYYLLSNLFYDLSK